MTPASDIIFTLLLFFILTQQALPLMKIELPAVGETRAPSETRPVIVVLTSSGSMIFDGVDLPRAGWEAKIPECVRSIPASSAIVIEVDRSAPAGFAVELLDRLQAAGITNIAFAGRERERSEK